ncbi:hypothetical protein [Neorhizobium sp. T25_27]|uniref:hypothetical protein n=1 Tax=Neorhizobium sp. T25_27 TaxID=2093831 RepID=UPI000CF85F18|nr:hypothetical protein [Neorhizobium sp. T25_27]
MEFFRADKRVFEQGDAINTAGHFEDKHPEAGRHLEALMRERKPADKPDRSECLMLFRDEEAARLFHSKMTGGHLYRVYADPASILHEGDMNLVNQLAVLVAAGEAPIDGIDRYWREERTDTPIIEVLLKSAVIVEEIAVTSNEKAEYLYKAVGIKRTSPSDFGDDDYSILSGNSSE